MAAILITISLSPYSVSQTTTDLRGYRDSETYIHQSTVDGSLAPMNSPSWALDVPEMDWELAQIPAYELEFGTPVSITSLKDRFVGSTSIFSWDETTSFYERDGMPWQSPFYTEISSFTRTYVTPTSVTYDFAPSGNLPSGLQDGYGNTIFYSEVSTTSTLNGNVIYSDTSSFPRIDLITNYTYVLNFGTPYSAAGPSVDFNSLTQPQTLAVNSEVAAGTTNNIYQAPSSPLLGPLIISLPNQANVQVTPLFKWDYGQKVSGSNLSDTIIGSDATDIINGAGGDDVIADFYGTSAYLEGGEGDDLIGIGAFSSGTIDGGNGTDLLGLGAAVDLSKLSVSNLEHLETNGFTVRVKADQLTALTTIVKSKTGIGSTADLSSPVSIELVATNGTTSVDLSTQLGDNGGRGANVIGSADNETIKVATTVAASSITIPSGRTVANVIDGGEGNDSITGSDKADAILDRAGAVTNIVAGGGDDLIAIGNTFSSGVIDGGEGRDLLGVVASVDLSLLTLSSIEILETNGFIVTAKADQFDALTTIEVSETGIGAAVDLNGTVQLKLSATGTSTTLDLTSKLAVAGGRNAIISGSTDDEKITGGSSDDIINGSSGSDTLSGGNVTGDNDTAKLSGGGAAYTFYFNGPFNWTSEGIDGRDELLLFEQYQFDNITVGDQRLFDQLVDPASDVATIRAEYIKAVDKQAILDDWLLLAQQAATAAGNTASLSSYLANIRIAQTAINFGITAVGVLENAAVGFAAAVGSLGSQVVGYSLAGERAESYQNLFIGELAPALVGLYNNRAGNIAEIAKQLESLIANGGTIADASDLLVGYRQALAQIAETKDRIAAIDEHRTNNSELIRLLEIELRDSYQVQNELPKIRYAGELAASSSTLKISPVKVLDGYISQSTVFSDANRNGLLDTGEAFAATDSTGTARFLEQNIVGSLIARGGVDTSTNLPLLGQLSAPGGYRIISPLTTLVDILDGQGVLNASETVLASLGLAATVDLATLDPKASAQAGEADAAAVFAAGAKVYSSVLLIGSVLAGSGAALTGAVQAGFDAVASAIQAETLQLDNPAAVSSLIASAATSANIDVPAEAKTAVAAIIASGNGATDALIQRALTGQELLNSVVAIQLTLQGVATKAIQGVAGDSGALASLAEQLTGANLDALIALTAADLSEQGQGQNQAPFALAQSTTTSEDNAVSGALAGIDIDVDPLTYSIVTGPTNGAVVLNGSRYDYTPAANFDGTDSFTFKANDGIVDGNVATVTITVVPVNDAAVIGGAVAGAVTEDKIFTAAGKLTVSDVDTGETSFQLGTFKSNFGSLALSTDGTWSYTLDNANTKVQALNGGQSLTDTIKVMSLDGTSADVAITINGTDEAAVANLISGTARGEKLNGTVGDDVITPLGGKDCVNAGKGNDIIKASINDGSDFYDGGAGSDMVDYSALTQGVNVKLAQLFGLSGGIVTGKQSGTDLLASIENVVGSQAGDTITGNKLANIIEGSGGNDRLTGSGGSDIFLFKPGFGNDTITDFTTGGASHDILQFSTDLFADWNAVLASITDSAKGAVISAEAGNSILLAGVTNAALVDHHVDDFLFV